MQPQSKRFPMKDGIELVADVWGDARDRPIILLHGGGQTRHAWKGTARELASRGWYAVAVDQRGHGDSGWSHDGNYLMEKFVEDLVEITGQMSIPPVIVGASLGGVAAMMAAGEVAFPIFAAVILVDIAPKVEPSGVAEIIGFMGEHINDGFETPEDAADVIAAYLPHRSRPKNLSGLTKNLRKGVDGRYRWHWDPAFIAGEKCAAASRDKDPGRLERAARKIRIPNLLIRGKLSSLVSQESVDHFLKIVPNAKFVDVSNAGHMVAGDVNDVFTGAVVKFLDEEIVNSQRQ